MVNTGRVTEAITSVLARPRHRAINDVLFRLADHLSRSNLVPCAPY